jgi:hypothetical protein
MGSWLVRCDAWEQRQQPRHTPRKRRSNSPDGPPTGATSRRHWRVSDRRPHGEGQPSWRPLGKRCAAWASKDRSSTLLSKWYSRSRWILRGRWLTPRIAPHGNSSTRGRSSPRTSAGIGPSSLAGIQIANARRRRRRPDAQAFDALYPIGRAPAYTTGGTHPQRHRHVAQA